MARNVNAIIEMLSAAQRKKVEARSAQLIAEEVTLREIRKARKLTQQKIAKSSTPDRKASQKSKSAATS
jgi:hypothetical protein